MYWQLGDCHACQAERTFSGECFYTPFEQLLRQRKVRMELQELLFDPGHEPGGIPVVDLSQHLIG